MSVKPKKSTRIADGEHAALTALAEKYDVSLSWLTRQAVVEFLKMQGRSDARLPLELPVQKRREN